MNNIAWNQLTLGVPKLVTCNHNGKDCIALAVRKCSGLPWFVNTTFVAPAVEILSDEANFLSIFITPEAVDTEDVTELFRCITACVYFLSHKRLALVAANVDTFCQNKEQQYIYTLSPKCQVVDDPSGQLLIQNLPNIFNIAPFRKNQRTEHVGRVMSISDLTRHPASWRHLEDADFLADIVKYTEEDDLKNLNWLIGTKFRGDELSWANHAAIRRDFMIVNKTRYNVSSFRELIRFIRNKLAHFDEIADDLRRLFKTPEDVIRYFNIHVITNGDLVFSAWGEINGKVEELKHHWIICRAAPNVEVSRI